MKRFTKIIALLAVLVAVLSVSAFAADFDHCADALKDLGLFQGTAKGYELDRAPNRAEAGAMLVRLLGKEDAAKQLTYTAPFTDVQDWAKPYVQYLYDNGLTKGKTATSFGYSDKCTAQQYATFLLRALGYSDAANGDFTYATAMDFAAKKNVVDVVNCDAANFLRDDVVAMSYTALSVSPKSGEADLLTKLTKEGSIKDAKGYDQQFKLYRDFAAAGTSAESATKSHMTMDINMDMKMGGLNYMTGTMKMDMLMDLNEAKMDQSKMAVTADTDMKIDEAMAKLSGLTPAESALKLSIKYYYTNGCFYMDAAGQKMKMPLSFEDAMAQMGTADMNASQPVSLMKNITAKTVSGATVYTVEFAPSAFSGLFDMASSVSGVDTAATPDMNISKLAMNYSVKNGKLDSMNMDMAMAMTIEGEKVDLAMTMKTVNVAEGSAVTVTLPTDLSTYPEMPAA